MIFLNYPKRSSCYCHCICPCHCCGHCGTEEPNFELKDLPPPVKTLAIKQMRTDQIVKLSLGSREAARDVASAGVRPKSVTFDISYHMSDHISFQIGFRKKYKALNGLIIKETDICENWACQCSNYYWNGEEERREKKQTVEVQTIAGDKLKGFVSPDVCGFVVPASALSKASESVYTHFSSIFPNPERTSFKIEASAADEALPFFPPGKVMNLHNLELGGEWEEESAFDRLLASSNARTLIIEGCPPCNSRVERVTADTINFKLYIKWLTKQRLLSLDVKSIILSNNYGSDKQMRRNISLFNYAVKIWLAGTGLHKLTYFNLTDRGKVDMEGLMRGLETAPWDKTKRPCFFYSTYPDRLRYVDLTSILDVVRADGKRGTVIRITDKEVRFVVWNERSWKHIKRFGEMVERYRGLYEKDITMINDEISALRRKIFEERARISRLEKQFRLEKEEADKNGLISEEEKNEMSTHNRAHLNKHRLKIMVAERDVTMFNRKVERRVDVIKRHNERLKFVMDNEQCIVFN